ncbi:hypothetical protein EOM39_04100 [Candidatus Gracilibacteria bacterium]|nr:hypothetical protein [Candidatus Gracilibacteria bacterium]
MKKSYSLALGGGAAKGLCHIGVLKYIEENNIQINEISGTSMGSIIGACFAVGITSEEIKNIAKDIKIKKLADLDFRKGLIKGNKIYKFLEEIFGNLKIEDTKISLKIIATDLNSGEKVVFVRGKIIDAIRASISLPMIFSTFDYDKSMFIDGGFKSNLPILELDGKNIIAVSAVRDYGRKINTHNRLFNFKFKKLFFGYNLEIIKKLIIISMCTNEDLTIEIAKNNGKNIILLAPNLGEFEFHDFEKVGELYKKGYEEAVIKLKM